MPDKINREEPLYQCECCGDMCYREELGRVMYLNGTMSNTLACSQACHDSLAAERHGLSVKELNDIKQDNPPTEPTNDELPF